MAQNNQQYKYFLWLSVAVLIVFALGFEIVNFSHQKKSALEIDFLDVGQGDSILIQYLGSQQILVDGGPDGRKLLRELSKTMPAMDRSIELVVLTHPDKDHLAGLIDVMEKFNVELVLHNGQVADTDIFGEFQSAVEKSGVESRIFGEGSTIFVGDDIELRSFNPDEVVPDGADRNKQSIVLRLDYGVNSFLLTGDAENSAEVDMLNDQEDVDVEWLKIGHHGSKSSTSESFLQAVTPKYAIVSAGRNNRYGHPHQEVLERLESVGAEVLRTDEIGTIAVECTHPQKKCKIISKNNP